MKEILKRFVPKGIKEVVGGILNERKIVNVYKTRYARNALLSYVTMPFFLDSLSHTSFIEARVLAELLSKLGFNVDVVSYASEKQQQRGDLSKYDVICGFGDVFQRYFEDLANEKKAITIHYATGMHVCHQNHMTLQRVKDVYQRKGVWLAKSARFVEKTWTHQTLLVDAIIAVGNQVCAESYKRFYDGKVFSLPVPFFKVCDGMSVLEKKGEASQKSFLWFGNNGLVHKGLDLVLDFFSQNSPLTLHVCGNIFQEKEFVKVYYKELFETPNILCHGFVDINTQKFQDILASCDFVIFPSCSEGGAASVITAMGNGGLIPVITRETAISTGNEIWIEDFTIEAVERAVRKALSLSMEERRKMQCNNMEYVIRNNSIEAYKQNLENILKTIVGEFDAM